MLFAKDQHMIQALAAKRPDQAFNIWVLPWRPRCDEDDVVLAAKRC